MDRKRISWLLIAALLQAGATAATHAQAIGSVLKPVQGVHAPGPAPRLLASNGEPQLKPMFIDKKLLAPDKWWRYEEADDDRPFAFSVEQTSSVSLGGHTLIDHGAQVQYRVQRFATPATAHLMFRQRIDASRRPLNVRRTETRLHQGDESVEVATRLIDDKGKVVEFGKETIARYGKYVVYVACKSDLRALGPRPKSGERKWMCEPVYDPVTAAVCARWARYKMLLASR